MDEHQRSPSRLIGSAQANGSTRASEDIVHLSVRPHLAQGALPAEAVTLIGTIDIDIVLGSVDC